MEKMATPRQVAYIERLRQGNGLKIEKPLSELTMSEASELIQKIAVGANGNKNGLVAEGSKNIASRRGDFNQGAVTEDGQALAITFSNAKKILSKTFWILTYLSMKLQRKLRKWLLSAFIFSSFS